jgi:peptidyl-prolyl cis-trans isomerase C
MRFALSILIVVLAAASATAYAQTPFNPQTVVVSRGDAKVTLQDVDDYMQRVPADKRAALMDSPKRIENLLFSMLINEQLAQDAEKLKLDGDPEVKGKTGWERVEILSRLRIQRFMQELKIPDLTQLAHEEYLGHKEKYAAHGAWNVQRVFVASKIPGNKDAEKAAWDRATEARGKALAAPDQFDAIVAEYSDDADKANTKGIIADAYHAKADKWLPEVLAELHEPGDISNVKPAAKGYQFVKLISKAPDVIPPYESVRDNIIATLKQDYVDGQRRSFLDRLSEEKLVANPEAVASLRIRYDTPVPAPSGAASTGGAVTQH